MSDVSPCARSKMDYYDWHEQKHWTQK